MQWISRLFPHHLLNWPTASLRTYLVAMTLTATVPLAALMSYQIVKQIQSHDRSVEEGLARSAGTLARAVNRELVSSADALTLLSYAAEIQQDDPARFEESLLRRPLARQSWSGVYLRTLSGQIVFDTSRPNAGQHVIPNDTPPNQSNGARKPGQKVVVSNLQPDQATGGFVTSVEVPVTVEGAQGYILGARIHTPVWQQLIAEAGNAAPDALAIIDRDFRIIARNPYPERSIGNLIPAANHALISARPSGVARMVSVDSGHNYAAWDHVPVAGWKVAVGMRASPIDVARDRAQAAALATVAACLALGVLLSLLVARQMTHPLQRLARRDFSRPPSPIVVHEIAQLRNALVSAREQDEKTRELIGMKRDLLRKKADEFEAMLTSCPIGLSIADDRGSSDVKYNQVMKTLLGIDKGSHYRFVTFRHQGVDVPRLQQPLQRAAMHGESTFGMELELCVEDRPPSFVIANAVPLLDERGQPRGAICAMVDITERKAAEERQRSAEQRLRQSQHLIDLAQETGHVGFFHYRLDEQKLAWTPGQASLFGLSDGKAIDDLALWAGRINYSNWRGVLRALKKAFANGRDMVSVNYCVHLPDDSVRCLSSRMKLAYGPDGSPLHIIGVTVDMTEQVKAERERDELIVGEQAARREAESANRAKDEFLAMLGHELRNPLSAISSGIEVLNRVPADSDVAKNARRIIDRQTRHLAHMMDDLLDVGRVLSGQRLPRSDLSLGTLVQRVIASLQIAGHFRDHELVTDIDDVWIHANATRIEQVISNLIINSLKYTPSGGRVAVRVRTENGRAMLMVEDNGVGIPKELLPRVFDLFVQGERSLDRRSGGLGVGLTLVRRLVELHDGSIEVRDADPGTIMCVSLPVIDAPPVPETDTESPGVRTRRVAVIEDNEDLLEGLSTMLSLAGHRVMTCADGIAGVEMILTHRPDVAIVDVGLPGFTGYEVALRVRAAGFTGKLLAMSGYGQERDREQAIAAGFDMHFLKPAQVSELLEAIDRT